MAQCQFLLCRMQAIGLVRIVDLLNGDNRQTREVPMCVVDSATLGRALARGEKAHVTPGGAVYIGDLNNALDQDKRWRR